MNSGNKLKLFDNELKTGGSIKISILILEDQNTAKIDLVLYPKIANQINAERDVTDYKAQLILTENNINTLMQEIKETIFSFFPTQDYFSEFSLYIFKESNETGKVRHMKKETTDISFTKDYFNSQLAVLENILKLNINSNAENKKSNSYNLCRLL
jgi:hypothetical protein